MTHATVQRSEREWDIPASVLTSSESSSRLLARLAANEFRGSSHQNSIDITSQKSSCLMCGSMLLYDDCLIDKSCMSTRCNVSPCVLESWLTNSRFLARLAAAEFRRIAAQTNFRSCITDRVLASSTDMWSCVKRARSRH